MKNRWIALYVENQVGVLAKVSGLFSGKSYNLQSLTVGTTEDETISRMTICVTSDDITFEQIKKQLNRMVEVIKVIDLTNVPVHMKEILFAKVLDCTVEQKAEVFQIAQVFNVQVADIGNDSVLLECKLTERRNNELIALLKSKYKRIEAILKLSPNNIILCIDNDIVINKENTREFLIDVLEKDFALAWGKIQCQQVNGFHRQTSESEN